MLHKLPGDTDAASVKYTSRSKDLENSLSVGILERKKKKEVSLVGFEKHK